MMENFLSIASGTLVGVCLASAAIWWVRNRFQNHVTVNDVPEKLAAHFRPAQLHETVIAERKFPHRMRADLQRALDRMLDEATRVHHFSGVRQQYGQGATTLAECISATAHNPIVTVPPQYEELDIGEEQPIRVLQCGLWLLERGGHKLAVLLGTAREYGSNTSMMLQVATLAGDAGRKLTDDIFLRVEKAVAEAASYRGKILSLERDDHNYSGAACGVKVHRLKSVEREQVILPATTLALLDRNVIDFVRRRPDLNRRGLATKKGLLFYGPPGTGKTHTIHYLTRALSGHTTLLITSEQVGLLGEYMTLARLLQPAIVVIEDADLIARNRDRMSGGCEEVLLNKLLNEMDGLREQADVLFVLTTNRPESLEQALAARPGRIDQAIEFPLPDDEGRRKLVRLYSAGMNVPDDVVATIVARTERVSAAFVKELMRRSLQYQLDRDGDGPLTVGDVESALGEILFGGGSLNLKLLGAEGIAQST